MFISVVVCCAVFSVSGISLWVARRKLCRDVLSGDVCVSVSLLSVYVSLSSFLLCGSFIESAILM